MKYTKAHKSIVFADFTRGSVTGSDGFINPEKITGILETDFDNKTLQFRIPSQSFGNSYDVTTLYISSSNNNPRVGIGTTLPIGSFDISSPNNLIPPNFTLRTNNDNIVTVGEETGRIRFLIESSSFNLGSLDLAISGSTAEIFSRVTEVDSSGVKGSLVFGLSSTTTTSSIDAFQLGYEVGSSELSDGDIHAVFSASMEMNAQIPKIILNRADGNQSIVQIGSVNTNNLTEGSIVLRSSNTTGNAYFVIRNTNDSYISSSNNSNFGIGTSAPGEKLTVTGNISASNDIYGKLYYTDGYEALSRSGNILVFSNTLTSNQYKGTNHNFGNAPITASIISASDTGYFNAVRIPQDIGGSGTKRLYFGSGPTDNNGFIYDDSDKLGLGYNDSDKLLVSNTNPEVTIEGNLKITGGAGGNITASNDISASNDIFAQQFKSGYKYLLQGNDLAQIVTLNGVANTIQIGDTTTPNQLSLAGTNITTLVDFTSSANISASGYIHALTTDANGSAFNTLMVDTSTGRFYHTGSYGGGGGGGGGITEIAVGTGLDITNPTGPTATVDLDLTEVITSDGSNRILTSNGNGTLTGELDLKYDGTTLTILGDFEFPPQLGATFRNGIYIDSSNTSTIPGFTVDGNVGYGEHLEVPNTSTLTLFDIVYLGATGAWAAAQADAESTSKNLLGMVLQGGTYSKAMTKGYVRIPDSRIAGADLSSPSPNYGDPLYLSTGSAGYFQHSPPTTSNHVIRCVGYVVNYTTDRSGNVNSWIIKFDPSPDFITL